MRAHRDEGFPVTIVRPSMTYDQNLPIALGGWGTYTLADRLTRGRPVIVHGDGSSLWVVTHADDLARGLLGLLGNERALGRGLPHHLGRGADLESDLPDHRRGVGRRGQTSCTSRPTSSRRSRRRWPEACSATRRGASCSTTARSRRSCRGSRPTVPLREGIRRTLAWFSADAKRRSRRRGRERRDGSHPERLRGVDRVGRSQREGMTRGLSRTRTHGLAGLGHRPWHVGDGQLVGARRRHGVVRDPEPSARPRRQLLRHRRRVRQRAAARPTSPGTQRAVLHRHQARRAAQPRPGGLHAREHDGRRRRQPARPRRRRRSTCCSCTSRRSRSTTPRRSASSTTWSRRARSATTA